VTAFLTTSTAVLAAMAAMGVYDLQLWLEAWDHNRHLED
jgi:hypothetical protein